MKETIIPAQIKRSNIQKIVIIQFVIIVAAAVIGWQWNKTLALGIIYGSTIFIIPNTYFAWQSFRYIGAAQSKLVIQSFYKGQTTKFILTVAMFACLFATVKSASAAVVFCSYGLNALFHSIATAVIINKPNS